MTDIEKYIESQENAWTSTSFKTELSRLRAHSTLVTGQPSDLHEGLKRKGLSGSTIKTVFVRVADYWGWLNRLRNEDNPYHLYMEKHARVFKRVFVKQVVNMSFDEALSKLEQATMAPERKAYLVSLLNTGARVSELENVGADQHITGKGGKSRFVPDAKQQSMPCSHVTLWRELKRHVGLTPHDLRRLFATKMKQAGMDIKDIASLLGHSNIQTTFKYLQSETNNELAASVRSALTRK